MVTWELWRQDGSGNRVQAGRFDGRIGAMARQLGFESGSHGHAYWVEGPGEPVCTTNRDLYRHVLRLGRATSDAAWSLSAYLRSVWRVSAALKDRESIDLDTLAALLTAASRTAPPGVDPAWRSADLSLGEPDGVGYLTWERIVLSQIADLEDFAEHPPGPNAYYGTDAPRPAGCGARATPPRWCNFDPATYLECGVAGVLAGWDVSDGSRVPTPPGTPAPEIRTIESLTWSDLCRIAVCGQLYE
jgi:hypothetical protein